MSAHADHKKLYLGVFAALLALTVLTVGVSYVHMPHARAIAVGLLIAAAKVSLIATFFMHLKYERKLIHGFLFTAVFLVLSLLFMVLPDIG